MKDEWSYLIIHVRVPYIPFDLRDIEVTSATTVCDSSHLPPVDRSSDSALISSATKPLPLIPWSLSSSKFHHQGTQGLRDLLQAVVPHGIRALFLHSITPFHCITLCLFWTWC